MSRVLIADLGAFFWRCHVTVPAQVTASRVLSGPVFVMEWLFDLAQLMVFNVTVTGQPVLQGEWNYLQSLRKEMKSTLLHVS